MALPLAAILAAGPAIIGAIGEVMASIRKRNESPSLAVEGRLRKAEEDLLQTASALAKVAEEVQALAQQLAELAGVLEAQRRAARFLLGLALSSLAMSLVALIFAVRS